MGHKVDFYKSLRIKNILRFMLMMIKQNNENEKKKKYGVEGACLRTHLHKNLCKTF